MRNKILNWITFTTILIGNLSIVNAQNPSTLLTYNTGSACNTVTNFCAGTSGGVAITSTVTPLAKVFDLGEFNASNHDSFLLNNVRFSITILRNFDAVPRTFNFTVRVYKLSGAGYSLTNRTLLATSNSNSHTIPAGNGTTTGFYQQIFQQFSAPFNIRINAEDTIAIEVENPDFYNQGIAVIHYFGLIGETQQSSYYHAPLCAVTVPTSVYATIGATWATTYGCSDIGLDIEGNGEYFTLPSANNWITYRDTVCEGASSVVYTVSNSDFADTYEWSYSGSGATIIGNGNPSVLVNYALGATSGTLSVTPKNFYGNGPTLTRSIHVDNAIIFPIIPANPEICVGETVTLTTYGGVSYRWEPPTGLDTLYGPVVNASPALSHSYTVVVEDAFGCTGTGTTFVTVHPLPTVLFNPENTTICAGVQDTIVLDGAATYAWLPTTGLTLSATGDTAILNLNNTTTYTIEAVSHFGCESTTTKTVNVNPNPTPVITFDGERLMSAPTGYVTYMWYVDGYPIIPIAWQHLYNIKKPGAYHVVVTDSNGCEGMSNIIDTKPLNIGEFNKHNVKIFPNPATNTVNIESPLAVNVNVLTIEGRKIIEVEDAKSIDISTLSNGIYFLEIIEPKSGATLKEKIIKSE